MGYIKQQVNSRLSELICWKAGKWCKDLSNFDKDQIVLARRLAQSISKTVDLMVRTKSGPKQDNLRTGTNVIVTQGSLIRLGSEG